jgi:hypothetical protein
MGITTSILLAGAALMGAQPADQSPSFEDGEGQAWRVVRSNSGIVLVGAVTNIHLGRDCKAGSPRYGVGTWEWANGGFVIIFGETRIGFPRQEIDIGQGERCRA